MREKGFLPETCSPTVTNPAVLPIEGLLYFKNFVSSEEEKALVEYVDSKPFSQVQLRYLFWHMILCIQEIFRMGDAMSPENWLTLLRDVDNQYIVISALWTLTLKSPGMQPVTESPVVLRHVMPVNCLNEL
jgi:hypothetical protein